MELATCCKQCDWRYVTTGSGMEYCAWACTIHGEMVKAWLVPNLVTGEIMTRAEFERKLNALRIGA
jgi:hypothetical protein